MSTLLAAHIYNDSGNVIKTAYIPIENIVFFEYFHTGTEYNTALMLSTTENDFWYYNDYADCIHELLLSVLKTTHNIAHLQKVKQD